MCTQSLRGHVSWRSSIKIANRTNQHFWAGYPIKSCRSSVPCTKAHYNTITYPAYLWEKTYIRLFLYQREAYIWVWLKILCFFWLYKYIWIHIYTHKTPRRIHQQLLKSKYHRPWWWASSLYVLPLPCFLGLCSNHTSVKSLAAWPASVLNLPLGLERLGGTPAVSSI